MERKASKEAINEKFSERVVERGGKACGKTEEEILMAVTT